MELFLICAAGTIFCVSWWLVLNYFSTQNTQIRTKKRVTKRKWEDPRKDRYYKK
jgi:hypothetical protein